MARPLHPLPRLRQLATEQEISVSTLAGVISRSESYMRKRYQADSYLLDLPIDELDKLAAFFGVPVRELGG